MQLYEKLRKTEKIEDLISTNHYIYLEKCAIKFDADFGFKLDDNLKMPVNVMAYPDLNATPKGLLYTWGDISATA